MEDCNSGLRVAIVFPTDTTSRKLELCSRSRTSKIASAKRSVIPPLWALFAESLVEPALSDHFRSIAVVVVRPYLGRAQSRNGPRLGSATNSGS